MARALAVGAEIDEGANRAVLADHFCNKSFVQAVLDRDNITVIGKMGFNHFNGSGCILSLHAEKNALKTTRKFAWYCGVDWGCERVDRTLNQ